MRILLLGSTGLIGGHVWSRLAASHQVLTIGRRKTCDIDLDLARPAEWANLVLPPADVLVHCAGPVNEDFVDGAVVPMLRSTEALAHLVQKAGACGVRTIVYLSTAHVYGAFKGRISESSPLLPMTDYARTHCAAEATLREAAAHDSRLRILILRPCSAYAVPEMGIFKRWGLMPYRFPLQAVYRQRIEITDTGEQRRNFIAGEDLAGYIEACLVNITLESGVSVMNPIGEVSMSVVNLARLCAQAARDITGRDCAVVCGVSPDPQGDSAFEYASCFNSFLAKGSLDAYVRVFTRKVWEDLQCGVKYGGFKDE